MRKIILLIIILETVNILFAETRNIGLNAAINETKYIRKELAILFRKRSAESLEKYLDNNFKYYDDINFSSKDGKPYKNIMEIKNKIPWLELSLVFENYNYSSYYGGGTRNEWLILQRMGPYTKRNENIRIRLELSPESTEWKITEISVRWE
ncbi:hypothetical protein CH370_08115 [Leptospira kmetyi]|uniref:hypothetical protein n=1 Tax=Leptospira kmetyi TaxID=408139 RepID=UPI000C2A10A2|nr:hypothetical protein [Leptospira kmetyi]PJZ42192.1 hypothetical protein CH370_08115 [Leptospira kmetyi]